MSRSFLALTVALSILTFGGVWLWTSPAGSATSFVSRDEVYYSGCDEARSSGAAPLHRGQPGYRPEMDSDDDGIACEPYRSASDDHGSSRQQRRR